MADPAITYSMRSDVTPEAELSSLAAVYKFLLDCRANKKEGSHPGVPDAAKGSKHDSRHLKYTG